MSYRVFISYATGDEDNVSELCDALSRLKNVEPYVAEWTQIAGKNLDDKIKEGLERSHAVIALITYNSTNTMWLNQEIGYAFAIKIPIISVVEKGIDVKGFLEKQEHLVFQRGNFKRNIYQIIAKLRLLILKGVPSLPVTEFSLVCPACKGKSFEPLPSQEVMDTKIKNDQLLEYTCKFCSKIFYVDPTTLAVVPNSGIK